MKQKIKIIYQDENIVVVNKAAGISVIPDQYTCKNETLVSMLESQLNQKMWIIYAIDRGATGVLLFAKRMQVYKDISMQFENSKVHNKYIVLLSGVVENDEGTINKHIFISDLKARVDKTEIDKESIINFKVLERFKSYTLVQVRHIAGKSHQIRRRFWSFGHPLAIDDKYAVSDPINLSTMKHNYKLKKLHSEKSLISRLTLHVASLTLVLPESIQEKTFEALLPKDFEITLKQLRKYWQ
jgi:23S rRNA-/tRNA-specific pseudouridylate synthase